MKIRGEAFSATQRLEFENLKKFGKCSSSVGNRRRPKYMWCRYKNSEQVLASGFGTQQQYVIV